MKKIKEYMKSNVMSIVLYIIIGILLIINPDISAKLICYVGVVIMFGIAAGYLLSYCSSNYFERYPRYDLTIAITLVICAFIILWKVDYIVLFMSVILGASILFNGIVKLQHAIDLKRVNYEGWVYVLIFAALSIVISIVLLSQYFEATQMFITIMGVGLLFSGITDIFTIIVVNNKIKAGIHPKEKRVYNDENEKTDIIDKGYADDNMNNNSEDTKS